MNKSVQAFIQNNILPEDIMGKDILEVGSRDINGSIRALISKYQPKTYVGVDIIEGPSVDLICNITDLVRMFGKEKFDVVITTETMEHVKNWRMAIDNLKDVTKRGGVVIITTRSIGFDYHGYPHDYWRYQMKDMKLIFNDFEKLLVVNDEYEPGVLLKGYKPYEWNKQNNSDIELFSILLRKRVKSYAWWHLIVLYVLGAKRRLKRAIGIKHIRDHE